MIGKEFGKIRFKAGNEYPDEFLMPINWHQRFLQQARWTENIRAFLLEKAHIKQVKRILEVGSGTGAVLTHRSILEVEHTYGLDINSDHIAQSITNVPSAHFIIGDGHHLPFCDGAFDLVYCHYLLLWVSDPYRVVAELKRITRSKGFVIAMAEPDHEARIDYPDTLKLPGELQTIALRNQGADSQMGRKLGSIFINAGLDHVEVGILGAQWCGEQPLDDFKLEWSILEEDIKGDLAQINLEEIKKIDFDAITNSYRILFVPTFYAIGEVN
jgi:SAM-dependent methyltransferase